jgi:SH3 domain-containing protein
MKKLVSLLIALAVVWLWTASIIPIPAAALAVVPTYDPRPLCSDRTGATTPIVRYDIPFGSVSSGGVYCRPLVQNGQYLVNSAQIGNQDVINLGINQAVDVFAILGSGTTVTTFNNSITICLQGTGSLYFLDASKQPRTLTQLTATSDGSYTCGSISTAGTVVLTNTMAAPAVPPVSTLAPGETPEATPEAPIGPIGALTNCRVTITKIVRLRAEPNTTSKIMARLPYNTTWTATAHVTGWYQIIWTNTQGWVSESFLKASGNCK